MGISPRIVDWLRSGGHDVIHTRDDGQHRAADGEIFSRALRENRIVLTFDLDFGEIAALSAGQAIGVVLFRLHNTRTEHVLARLAAALAASAEALERGAVVIVEESRLRVRPMPIAKRPS